MLKRRRPDTYSSAPFSQLDSREREIDREREGEETWTYGHLLQIPNIKPHAPNAHRTDARAEGRVRPPEGVELLRAREAVVLGPAAAAVAEAGLGAAGGPSRVRWGAGFEVRDGDRGTRVWRREAGDGAEEGAGCEHGWVECVCVCVCLYL